MRKQLLSLAVLMVGVALVTPKAMSFGMCDHDYWSGGSNCPHPSRAPIFWTTYSVFLPVTATIHDGNPDLNNENVKMVIRDQAEKIVNGEGASIPPSENLIAALGQDLGRSDTEVLAQDLLNMMDQGSIDLEKLKRN